VALWSAHLLMLATVQCWRYGLRPTNNRDWADDVARITHGQVASDQLLLEHVRDLIWRSDQDYYIRWSSRRYNLTQLRSVDLLTS
jgi:hypothetical protein